MASAGETAFRWLVYDYEEPAFGSYAAETAMVLPWARPLKWLGRAGDLLRLWGRADTLADHFVRHGADFGARTADEYLALGTDFLQRSQLERLPTKIDSGGVIRAYDAATNMFGAFNPDGTIRTFFKPDPKVHGYPTNLDYWRAQPGASPWTP